MATHKLMDLFSCIHSVWKNCVGNKNRLKTFDLCFLKRLFSHIGQHDARGQHRASIPPNPNPRRFIFTSLFIFFFIQSFFNKKKVCKTQGTIDTHTKHTHTNNVGILVAPPQEKESLRKVGVFSGPHAE